MGLEITRLNFKGTHYSTVRYYANSHCLIDDRVGQVSDQYAVTKRSVEELFFNVVSKSLTINNVTYI